MLAVGFSDAVSGGAYQGECPKCIGGQRGKCFSVAKRIECRTPGYPVVSITPDNWWELVEAAKSRTAIPNFVPFDAFRLYGVCAREIITPFTREVLSVYYACDGFRRLSNPAAFYDLPAIYVECCAIIENERFKLNERQSKIQGKS